MAAQSSAGLPWRGSPTVAILAIPMKIVANPRAGRGSGAESLRKLKELVRMRGIACEVIETTRPGQAEEIAEDFARRGSDRVVVMGGDGTITEAVNGVVNTPAQLGLISVGTGNDLARSLGLPYNDVAASLEVILSGSAQAIDVGCDGGRCFVSALGVGYPALVAEETNRMLWLRGPAAFFLSVYKALRRLEAFPVEIVLDDRELRLDCSAILVHNTPYTGGGLKMAPAARCDDGFFDVVVIDSIGKLDLMLNFPKVYRGRHLEHPSFSVYRSRRVKIDSEGQILKMADGDVCGSLPVDARMMAAALKVILPV